MAGVCRYAFAILCACVASCRTSTTDSGVKESVRLSNADDIPAFDCGDGDPVHFQFSRIEAKPAMQGLLLPPSILHPTDQLEWVDPNKEQNLRLSGCLDETKTPQVELRQALILHGMGGASQLTRLVTIGNETGTSVVGFDEAVFENKYDTLSLAIPFGTERFSPDGPPQASDGHLIIKGIPGASAAYAYEADKTGSGVQPVYRQVLIGSLKVGDPLADSACTFDESARTTKAQLGEAVLRLASCSRKITTGTEEYRITSLEIADPIRNIDVKLNGAAAISEILTVKVNHHNGCDSFVLRQGSVSYAGIGRPAFGDDCGEGLPDAPKRAATDPGSLKYRIDSPLGTETGFSSLCSYLVQCFVLP